MHTLIALPPARNLRDVRTLRVLYADDSPWSREVTCNLLLSLSGVELHLVENGVEAVQSVAERSFDLVLMDLAMPMLDGFLATERIRHFERANPMRTSVPVVGYATETLVPSDPRLARCGLNAVLLKPCTAREMSACLARWCGALPARATF